MCLPYIFINRFKDRLEPCHSRLEPLSLRNKNAISAKTMGAFCIYSTLTVAGIFLLMYRSGIWRHASSSSFAESAAWNPRFWAHLRAPSPARSLQTQCWVAYKGLILGRKRWLMSLAGEYGKIAFVRLELSTVAGFNSSSHGAKLHWLIFGIDTNGWIRVRVYSFIASFMWELTLGVFGLKASHACSPLLPFQPPRWGWWCLHYHKSWPSWFPSSPAVNLMNLTI